MEIATLLVAGLANGSLYALVGLGLVLVYNAQGIPNFGHGELFMAGAFLGFTAYEIVGLPFSASVAVALVFSIVLGVLIETLTIRPVAANPTLVGGSYGIALVMVTVGLSVTMKGIVRIPYGDRVRDFPSVLGNDPYVVWGIVITPQHVLIIALASLMAAAVFVFLRYAKLGKRMRATAQNRVGAKIVGIDTDRVDAATWGLAAAIGALAGILAAPLMFLDPDMGVKILMKGFAAAVLGGFGSVPGVIAGGLIMGVIEMICGRYISTALLDISAFLVIMLVLLLRPQGLFGKSRVMRV